jgi:hypothetical protein
MDAALAAALAGALAGTLAGTLAAAGDAVAAAVAGAVVAPDPPLHAATNRVAASDRAPRRRVAVGVTWTPPFDGRRGARRRCVFFLGAIDARVAG